jgi:putative peptide zinc metalloprotease protein
MMSESLFSTYWYRVANLKPVLRDTAIISRHVYRGQPWYVLRNSLSGHNHRFNAAAYALIGQMDGQRTVQEIWENAGKLPADAVPTQDEVIRLLGRLHDADLIQSDILPSTVELFRQAQGQPSNSWKQRMSNPFSLRFPLYDPDRLLERWSFLSAPMFTRGTFFLWLLVVLSAVVAAVINWPELSGSLADRLFLPSNLLLLWLIYPLVKILHEFGHAFALKKWGGEVHEMGIMLLALTPIPYIDATASASFPDKQRRIAVAAMGMMVELLLASLALFVWLNVETGLISALAYNVMLIGGISTLLFNGNPLLRYDGYYMLADLIEIPNLGQRSTRYLGYLLQRYLLGNETAESPVSAPGEQGWFLVYGPISFCYRIAVMLWLVWLVSSRFFVVGVLIASWGAVSLLMLPAVRNLSRFLDSPAARSRRSRLVMVGGGAVLGVVLLMFVIPMPLWTTTQGVVWLPEQSMIRAGTDCEVVEVLAPLEQLVAKDAPLLRGVDFFLETEIEVYQAQLAELYARYNALPLHERVKRKMMLEEIELVRGDLHQTEEKLEKLLIRSPAQGNFVLIDARNLSGRFVKKGELLGYIVSGHRPTIRAVVSQADIGLVRERVTGVEVRLTEKPAESLKAVIERIVPAADLNLPSAALGTAGGGVIPIDPTDPDRLRALESLFQLDLSLPEEVKDPHIGGRVYVRFEHGSMPLAMQWYRSLRQLFLRKFYV